VGEVQAIISGEEYVQTAVAEAAADELEEGS